MRFETLKEEIHADLATWDGKTYLEGTFHKLPAGHWTDDTEMALALAESLIASNGAWNGDDVSKKYLAWSQGTPHGMGGSTRNAMNRLKDGVPYTVSGELFETPESVGSGTVMRCAPLGVAYRSRLSKMHVAARMDALITHNDINAEAGSVFVTGLISELSRWSPKDPGPGIRACAIMAYGIVQAAFGHGANKTPLIETITKYAWEAVGGGTPTVSETLNVGRRGNVHQITCTALLATAVGWEDFGKGIEFAVRLGGDTDTRAAIAGAMLGALHGQEGIPDHYKTGLKDYQMIADIDQKLWALGEIE